ncbi:hypothetical protein [Streptomyces scabiei]|uniref:hypothetical protein n=1 Tax=Streptomyces scabiei TaxID=1930 RepID=UPI00131B27FF|nr:hypothetical protein [Streptomyces scabiei]
MQTPEQQYAAHQASALRGQADQHDQQATAGYQAISRTAWDRPTTDAEMAGPRRHRATATELRAQADQIEAQAVPKKKRRWL